MAKNKNQSFWKRINSWLHLWLGLGSGVIVFVVCLSGTLFVFNEECNTLINRDARHVAVPHGAKRVAVDVILENLKKEYPEIMMSQYTEYSDPSRTVMFKGMDRSRSSSMNLTAVYADPYSGYIIKASRAYGFFRMMAMIHVNLMLGKVGSYIVQISTVIFLLELISGLIWWWPKRWSKTNVNKSFKVKWKANWKRLNLDLHNVLGFYVIPMALMLTVTALVICYVPVKSLIFGFFGSSGREKAIYQVQHPVDSTKRQLPFEQLIAPYRKDLDHVKQLTSTLPSKRSGAILVRIEEKATLLTFDGSQQFVDTYSGRKIMPADDVQKADRLLNATISLHIGVWAGLFGKILTFVACLICTSLPITGFIIWYNRKFKKKSVRV